MKEKLVIIGLGETAQLAYEYFTNDSYFEVVAFAVDKQYIQSDRYLNLPVVDFETLEIKYDPSKYKVFVAIASGMLNRNRTSVYKRVKGKGYKCASYISSKAFVWQNVTIGENCFILENNVLQPFTTIGNNVYMWSGNHLGHRSIIHDNCFITSHVVISGFCEIGENTFLGVNSSVADNVKIAEDNYIGMGSIIGKNTKPDSIYSNQYATNMKISAKEYFGVEK